MDCQSGTEKFNISVATAPKTLTSQNVQFKDQNPAYSYAVDSEYDPTRTTADANDASLEQFFSRPLKIAQYEWSTSVSEFFETLNPWILYWENARVINRISNFNLLRAKMHVKIIINGNGFHYGRLIASYLPLHTRDDFTVTRGFFSQDIVQASQRPHVYLDPTTSQGGSLMLPFFWHKNSLSIPDQEWREMGDIIISTLSPLKHANGANDRVTISVFAWAEDVHMSIPTSAEPGALSPQCAEELLDPQAADEYAKDGAISAPASTIARVAGMLKSAPAIGPFAKATELAASSIAGIARIFGYSRPVVLADIEPFKPVVMGNIANSNVADSAFKLSLDAKQEITIDPRVTGLSGTDELSIKSISCRESYLTQFPWVVQTDPETALFSTEVSPVVWDTLTVDGGPEEIHMPACCFATVPFLHWRGSMKYRFQIVSSNFHKGRLKVVWDPHGFQTNEYNTNYTHIIDIAEDKDFTIEVGWGNEHAYVSHRLPGSSDKIFKNSAPTTVPGIHANGVLAVYVVNELTVPSSTVNNDITVNVFVSTGDDFEVANPYDGSLKDLIWFKPAPQTFAIKTAETTIERQKQRKALKMRARMSSPEEQLDPQSAEESSPQHDREDTTEPSAPMQTQTVGSMGQMQDDTDNMIHVHFGESIPSFRSCLKRYNFHAAGACDLFGAVWYSRTQNNLPFYKGRAPSAIHNSGSYNYAKMTLLNYLLPAFTGYRGATRWKYQYMGADGNKSNYMSVRRLPFNAYQDGYEELSLYEFGLDTPDTMAYESQTRIDDTWTGAAVTATGVNPCVEVELPYYSNLRFGFAKNADLTQEGYNNYFHKLDMNIDPKSDGYGDSGSVSRILAYNAVGEDFNLFFFTGCPIAYREAVIPAP